MMLLCGMLLVTSVAMPGNDVHAEETSYEAQGVEQEQTIYSLVHKYHRIRSAYNGQYLLGNRAGYEAQAITQDTAMVFYFQPSDLGEYILYDADGKYLTYNSFNAIVRNTTLNDRTRFKITDEGEGKFSLFSYSD